MNIKTLKTDGFAPAIFAMRAPMQSWSKSDSTWDLVQKGSPENGDYSIEETFTLGDKDRDLSLRLQKAGPEHCKHLRMIQVWAEIEAPREWWIQFDTYRYGVEKVSTSTMHTLMRRPLDVTDFEHDCMNDEYLHYMLDSINTSMEAWRCEKDEEYKKQIWRSVIEALPQSYIQKRYVMISYAALRSIIHQREGHKLHEWAQFIDWCRSLPYPELLFE